MTKKKLILKMWQISLVLIVSKWWRLSANQKLRLLVIPSFKSMLLYYIIKRIRNPCHHIVILYSFEQVGTEWVTKGQNIDQTTNSVAGIARGLYERVFKFLVEVCNKTLVDPTMKKAVFIGVLDIAGFEIFKVFQMASLGKLLTLFLCHNENQMTMISKYNSISVQRFWAIVHQLL